MKSNSSTRRLRNPVGDTLRLSQQDITRIPSIEKLARQKAKETVFLLHSVGLFDGSATNPCDIGKEAFARAIATGVLPKWVNIAGATYRRSSMGRGHLTASEWETADTKPWDLEIECTGPAQGVIVRILHARVSSGDNIDAALPTYTVAQLLGEVGVDRPTRAQRDFAADQLSDLFGPPKLLDNEFCWRLQVRSDGHCPDWQIVQMYPLPQCDRAFSGQLIDHTDAGSPRRELPRPTRRSLPVGALIY